MLREGLMNKAPCNVDWAVVRGAEAELVGPGVEASTYRSTTDAKQSFAANMWRNGKSDNWLPSMNALSCSYPGLP
eukprot:6627624-Prorocentrum_lima.AAC.1